MKKKFKQLFFIFIISLFLYPVSAQSDSLSPENSSTNNSENSSQESKDSIEKEISQVTKEFCRKNKKATQIQNFISEEFVNRITTEQYNNIIKMFSIRCDAITEGSSLVEKKYILAYWIKEKYFNLKEAYISYFDFYNSIKKINENSYEANVEQYVTGDALYFPISAPENHILIIWIKEGDEWRINDLKYDFESPLFRNEYRYNMNKNHKSKISVDARFNKNIDADITIPIVEGNLKNFSDYYAGGILRWNVGNNQNKIFKTYNGFSWQLTDTDNYFFIDLGAGLKFNIFFGDYFSVTPEITALGKINMVFSYLVFGFDTEGGSTFHFYSTSGREMFYLRSFYQHTFLFKFDSSSEDKGLNNFNLGKICFGIGFPIY